MSARRLVCLLVTLLGFAAPARGLLVAGPIDAVPTGCTHDLARTGAINPLCGRVAPGLGGPAALAVDAGRLFVAAADDGAVTALTRHGGHGIALGGPSPRARDCVAATGTACSRIVGGLAGVDALAISPDGRDVYAGSRDDHAVVGLTAAALAPIANACVTRHARHSCAGTVTLRSVGSLAMSPDGRYLYAAGFGAAAGQDALVTLSRSVRTGALHVDRQAPCVQSLGRAAPVCPIRSAGLEGLSSVIVTADGRFLYAASSTSGAVVGFLRNRFSGRLEPLRGAGGCLHDAATTAAGDHGCATATPGLRGARGLALSRDGATLIVIAADPGSVVALARNPTTGALAPRPGGCLSATVVLGCTTLAALRGAQAGVVAARGRQLLVAALGANSLLALGLDPTSGTLSAPSVAVRDVGTLSGPTALATGDDGHTVYVASALDDSVATLVDSAVPSPRGSADVTVSVLSSTSSIRAGCGRQLGCSEAPTAGPSGTWSRRSATSASRSAGR